MFLLIGAILAFLAWGLTASWTRIGQALLVILGAPWAVLAVLVGGAWLAGQFIGLLGALVAR
jgi:hypothetical protein